MLINNPLKLTVLHSSSTQNQRIWKSSRYRGLYTLKKERKDEALGYKLSAQMQVM